jgi:hypothetical protein
MGIWCLLFIIILILILLPLTFTVFGVVESVVPNVAAVIPYSDKVVGLGLDMTASVAHFAYNITKNLGIMTSNPDYEEVRARIMTKLTSLADMSMEAKDKFLKALYAEAGKQEFLLGLNENLYASLTTEQDAGINMWTTGFSGLYDVSYAICRLFPCLFFIYSFSNLFVRSPCHSVRQGS